VPRRQRLYVLGAPNRFARNTVSTSRRRSLFFRHSRVVGALQDEHRLHDLCDVAERRNPLEHGLHLRVAFIAVLCASVVAAIAFRVRQEGSEIADAVALDAADEPVGVVRHHRERHVAAVGLAVDRDAARVEPGLRLDPVEQSADILY
jgi:hypothetical protein